MEYAVTIGVIALFVALYLAMRPALRERAFVALDEKAFKSSIKSEISKMQLPQNGGSAPDDKRYKNAVGKAFRYIKRNKKLSAYRDFFPAFAANRAAIEELSKKKFDILTSLPAVDGEPRAVVLARLTLAHSDYIFSANRFCEVADAQNGVRTLTYGEINDFQTCFEYVLLEKLAYLSKNVLDFIKMEKLAKKFVKDPDSFSNTPIFKSLEKNKLFLSICAERVGLECDEFSELRAEKVGNIIFLLNNVFDSLNAVKYYDFKRHYSPLGVLNGYPYFENAPDNNKTKFLQLLSDLSERENMDELIYAKRLCSYAGREALRHVTFKRADILDRKLVIAFPERDIRLLARALTLPGYMRMFFGENKKNKSQSILEKCQNENSISDYYEKTAVDFGLSVNGDKLKLKPRLDKNILSATLVLEHNGIEHRINVVKGKEREIKLGETTVHGVEEFVLGNYPLNINAVTCDDE